MKNPRIKAVFFDMDGTLVHLPADFSEASFMHRVLGKLGMPFELETVQQAYQDVEGWWQEHFQDFTRWTRENMVEYQRRFLACLGLDHRDAIESLAERVQDHWERLPEEAGELLYPEARAALDELRRRELILGILSHRMPHLIECSLARHRISQYFRCLVSPQVANAPLGKLDPAMWEFALSEASVAPDEAVHIGDRYEHDVVGARAAGVLPILIDREAKQSEADCLKAGDLLEALQRLVRL